jgi:hypothetical protein
MLITALTMRRLNAWRHSRFSRGGGAAIVARLVTPLRFRILD